MRTVWYRRDIAKRFRSSLKDERDVHCRLMQAYTEVPDWWYALIALVSLIMGIIAIEIFPTHMPVWGFFFGLLFAAIFSIPVGMIQAITNRNFQTNILAELIAGYVFPNKPIANMIFKALGAIGVVQAITFSGDLKLGHYLKIPPRVMFTAQITATTISCVVVLCVQNWMFANIPDVCTPHQPHGFICASTRTFGGASLVWGGIGPKRLFSAGAL